MEKILNQSHDTNALLLALSRLFERSAYYGIRAVMLMYMLSESLAFSNNEAFEIYSYFTLSFIFTQIFGAVIGDFVIGNKWASIVGGGIQAIGALLLAYPSILTFYIGLGLITLGGGFYSPNLIASFGKTYTNKPKLLDAGFTMFYISVNIGAFLGSFVLGVLSEKLGYHYGFIAAAILFILSILIPLIIKQVNSKSSTIRLGNMNERSLKIVSIIMLSGLFWGVYEFAGSSMYRIQNQLSEVSELISNTFWSSLNPAFVIPIAILAVFLWTFYYNSQFIKLAFGFAIGAISFIIMFTIPEVPTESHIYILVVAIFLLALAEVLIAPTLFSVITRYANPKYLAILIALSYIPMRIISYLISFYQGHYSSLKIAFGIPALLMVLITIGLIVYLVIDHQNKSTERLNSL